MSADVLPSRAAKAAAVTLALVLFVSAAGALGESTRASAGQAEGAPRWEGGLSAREVVGDGDFSSVLQRLEKAADAGCAEAPDWFIEEVGLPAAARYVRVDSAGEVVGCVVDGKAAEVLATLGRRMEYAGWNMVPLGGVDGATFVKEGGECQWVMVTCTQVGSAVSVVFRCGSRA